MPALVAPILFLSGLAARVDAVLPQTQCTRCGYPDCAHYAQAVAARQAGVDQCPPGGHEGVRRIAAVVQQPVLPLNPEYGAEAPRTLAVIDEDWCIGCTLCLDACPTDTIVGASKRMHTVVAPLCTGCELCLPVCPVDCIALVQATDCGAMGWANWEPEQAHTARARYLQHQKRLAQPAKDIAKPKSQISKPGAAHPPVAGQLPTDGTKKALIALAVQKAKAKTPRFG